LKVLSLAQRAGVVPGGGAALVHSIPALDKVQPRGDAAYGVDIMRRALTIPMEHILANAGLAAPSVKIAEITTQDGATAYDVVQERIVDAYRCGLVDPVETVIAALTKAASTAMMALSIDAIVYHRNPKIEGEPA